MNIEVNLTNEQALKFLGKRFKTGNNYETWHEIIAVVISTTEISFRTQSPESAYMITRSAEEIIERFIQQEGQFE